MHVSVKIHVALLHVFCVKSFVWECNLLCVHRMLCMYIYLMMGGYCVQLIVIALGDWFVIYFVENKAIV